MADQQRPVDAAAYTLDRLVRECARRVELRLSDAEVYALREWLWNMLEADLIRKRREQQDLLFAQSAGLTNGRRRKAAAA